MDESAEKGENRADGRSAQDTMKGTSCEANNCRDAIAGGEITPRDTSAFCLKHYLEAFAWAGPRPNQTPKAKKPSEWARTNAAAYDRGLGVKRFTR